MSYVQRRKKNTTRRKRGGNVDNIHIVNKRNQERRRKNRTNGSYDIGQIKNAPILTRCIRYESPGTTNEFQWRNGDLMKMIGFATSTTEGYSIMQSVRIRRVKVTCMPDTSEVSGSCRFEWLGTSAPENEDTMVYMPAVPCSKNYYPPEGSSPWFWRSDYSNADALFSVKFTANIVWFLDIEFEWVMKNDTTTQQLDALTSATANVLVYPRLPINVSTSSQRLFPVGLPTG